MTSAGRPRATVAPLLPACAAPEAVAAFIRALAHRERCEAGASVLQHGAGTTEVCYPTPLAWPWPVQFGYVSEFFCTAPGAQSLREVAGAPGSGSAHVVNLFAAQPPSEAQHFIEQGYLLAWTSTLLARPLATAWSRPATPGAQVHGVADALGMAQFAQLPGISNPGTARDPLVHNVFATLGDEVVAKGQLVLLPGSAVAYVSDMFTHPAHRRRGLCHLVMQALEAKARALGATQACLAPGQEVAAFGLYGKYGYTQAGVRAVLVRA